LRAPRRHCFEIEPLPKFLTGLEGGADIGDGFDGDEPRVEAGLDEDRR
jgi:hypothetical protein